MCSVIFLQILADHSERSTPLPSEHNQMNLLPSPFATHIQYIPTLHQLTLHLVFVANEGRVGPAIMHMQTGISKSFLH